MYRLNAGAVYGIGDVVNMTLINTSIIANFPTQLSSAYSLYNFWYCVGETIGFTISTVWSNDYIPMLASTWVMLLLGDVAMVMLNRARNATP